MMLNNHQKIQHWINNHKIKNNDIRQLAAKIGVSMSAVSRFAQKEGFTNFQSLKEFNKRRQKVNLKYADIAYSLARTNELISAQKIAFLAQKIITKDQIIILGEGFTYICAQTFERKLRKININAKSMHVGEDLSILLSRRKNMYIFVSNSGKNKNVAKCAKKIYYSKERGMIVAITSNNFSNIEHLANETIKGFSIKNGVLNDIELPSISQMVTQFILDLIFEKVYTLNQQANDLIIEQIASKK